MSLARALANIIQQEAHTRGQLGIQKAGIIPGVIQQGALGMQDVLGQIDQNKSRKLRDEQMKREGELQDIELTKKRAEQEYRARIAKAPTKEAKFNLFTEYLSIYEPKALLEMKEAAQGEAVNRVRLLENRPGTELPKEAALPATPDSPIVPLEAQAQHPEITIPGVLGPDTTIRPRTESDVMGTTLAMKQAEAGIRDSVEARKEERRQRFTAGQAASRQDFETEKLAAQQDFMAQQNELNRRNRLDAAATSRASGGRPRLLGRTPDNKAVSYQDGEITVDGEVYTGPIVPAAGKYLSDTAIKEVTQSQMALAGLEELEGLLEKNKEYIGPIAGTLTTINPYSKGKQVAADIARVRQRVGKSLEGGVLRKEDEIKYKGILADIQDTDPNAMYKVRQLRQDVAREIELYSKNQGQSGRIVPQNVQDTVNRNRTSSKPKTWAELKALREGK